MGFVDLRQMVSSSITMVSNSITKVKNQLQIEIERLCDIYNSRYARKIRFLFERHDEGSHINVTTPKHVKSMLKELLKLTPRWNNVSR